ncbi:MAG: PH domain-containing protein [Motilibacteraceae bacterium]
MDVARGEPDGVDRDAESVFDPPGTEWTSVSPRLATLRRVVLLAVVAVLAAVLAVTGWLLLAGWVAVAVVLAALVALGWGWWWIGRNQRAWGYTERADDLLVRRGIAWRELVVVPYGRMQFVDVKRGPLQRWFGLACVQLHTAAAATDARIPGLLPEEAARLRDRLAARGEARAAGL